MWWAGTTRKDGRGYESTKRIAGERLWKSRSVEKSQSRLFHCAWKSRKRRGIPTFPQPRRRRSINHEADISCATKTGHFNLLPTEGNARSSVFMESCHPSCLCVGNRHFTDVF